MPGRGQYWKKGGLVDETVKEEDLSQALQTKVNAVGGGGGGLFYASLVWGEAPVSGQNTGSFGPLLGTVGIHMGETGISNVQGAFGKAGKVSNFVVRVATHGVGTTNVNLIKNGSTVKTYSFGNADVGTTVTDTTDTTFTLSDLIRWEVSSVVSAQWVAVAEFDFT